MGKIAAEIAINNRQFDLDLENWSRFFFFLSKQSLNTPNRVNITWKEYLKKQSKSRTKEQVSFIGHISKTRRKDPDTSVFNFKNGRKNGGIGIPFCLTWPSASCRWENLLRLSDHGYFSPDLFYTWSRKLKNVSCEYDRLNGWNSTLQAAWYIRHVLVV